MTDLCDRLRDADPLLNDPGLPPEEAAAIRRRVLETARRAQTRGITWTRTLAIAAAVAVIAAAGIETARRTPRPEIVPGPARTAATGSRTQVQFATPGGTRIIWTIDPAFQLTENR